MTNLVWSALSDGSHMHYRNGIGTVCKKNHKRFNSALAIWVTVAIVEFALIVYLLNKALEQKGW